ncbi:SDR family NAD(P)-dependent oxidoreductase [Amycolatopsis iheyensis]|uniref:SDR family NAD(P)-dependent oxidoreductase n=1 Tax=Amycolatopsis iheyensis TaxID=2945988 RepID=UPI003556CEE5
MSSTAAVTGAGRGFGRAIAAALVAGGRTVVGIARTRAEIDAVRTRRARAPVRHAPAAADPGHRRRHGGCRRGTPRAPASTAAPSSGTCPRS